MTYYGEQCPTLYIINHCSDSIDSYSYDNPRVCTYCYGEHHILFNTDHLNEELESIGGLEASPLLLLNTVYQVVDNDNDDILHSAKLE